MRRVAALALVLSALAGTATAATRIVGAAYDQPVSRYGHGALGGQGEWGALVLSFADGTATRIVLPETLVFEDTAPRLADLDGDGAPEVVVVEADLRRGARLAVYQAEGLRAATPFIGTRHRWLAPLGAADLDRDGQTEIAYIETPHREAVLKIVRLQDDRIVTVAEARGLNNHRFGESRIEGGIADCGNGPEIYGADSDWTHVMALQFRRGKLSAREVGLYEGAASMERALGCGG